MAKKEQSFNVPQIHLYDNNSYGYFGDYPIYDSDLDYRLSWLKSDVRIPKFKNVCFGPFIDFNAIKGFKTRSVDDFLVVCDEKENRITIYDQITLDNTPRKINWFDRDDRQQPIIFEPRLCLLAGPKVVDNPKYTKTNQSAVENMCFDIIQDMGFDDFTYQTSNRFFTPLPKINGKPQKYSVSPDSAFLIKSARDFYSWYKIYSADMAFEVIYFHNGEEQFRSKISNTRELIRCLKEDRERRNNYMKWQYVR